MFKGLDNRNGFTLIEVLILIVVIGILFIIAVPQFAVYRQKAFSSAAMSDLKNAKMGMEAYLAEHHKYPASLIGVGGI